MIDKVALDNATRFFGTAEPQICHQCERAWPLEEIVVAVRDGAVLVQGWTGRVFCAACWEHYKQQEGLP